MASVKFQGDGDGTVVSSTSEQVPLESRLVSRQALGEDWRLPVEVFADKYTPARKIRRMKSRAVRSYYHDLNDMIKKYMAIDKVEKRFERRMQRQQSKAVEEGITKAGPYSWYGSSDNLGSRGGGGGGNWMRDSSSSSSSTVALGSTDTELRQLPNHHYYRSHDHGGKKAAAADERAPLMGGPSRADVEQAQTDESELDDEDDEEAEKRRQAEAEENSWHIKLAIHATFWVNVALFVAKTFASVESLSLSIIASTLDSFLDLLSGSVIFFASWIVNGRSRELKFPGGTSRIEPLAVLIFAVAMFTATTQLLIRSAETLATGNPENTIGWVPMGIIAFTVVIKIVLWAYCATVKNSESVEAMMIDNRNDVITNSYGLVMIFFASRYYWWMDPLGAIGMSLYIMFIWFCTGYRNVKVMSGMSATPDFLNQVVYLAYNHHPSVVAIDTVRAFHLAYDYLVEVDIVLPQTMTVEEAHDIGEALQDKIEMLENVERAWVHIDYEYSHKPEHKRNFG